MLKVLFVYHNVGDMKQRHKQTHDHLNDECQIDEVASFHIQLGSFELGWNAVLHDLSVLSY